MNRTAFKATCEDCGKTFASPFISEFEYGSALFYGEHGTAFAMFSAFDNRVFELLRDVLGDRMPPLESGDLIFDACAHFADPVDGQRLSNHLACPRCRSTAIRIRDSEPMGAVAAPEATFLGFEALPETERRGLAGEYFDTRLAGNR